MSRKIKPCVTVPYWKILQDKEKDRQEEQREGKKDGLLKGTLLDMIGQATQSDVSRARRAEDRVQRTEAPVGDAGNAVDTSAAALISEGFSGLGKPGPKWEKHSECEGWWWHTPSGLIYSEVERKFFVWEELMQRHVETDPFFKAVDDAGLAFRAEASSAGSGFGCAVPPTRSVIIRDLVAAGQALKSPLRHLGKPAALFAIFHGHGSGSSDSAEFYAKNLHSKLLHLLSQYRGFWSENLVQTTISSAFEDLDQKFHAKQGEKTRIRPCSCAVALLIGTRVFVALRGECQATLLRSRHNQADLEGVALTRSAAQARDAVGGGRGGAAHPGGSACQARAAVLLQAVGAKAATERAQSEGNGPPDGIPRAPLAFSSCHLDKLQFSTQCLVLCASDTLDCSSPRSTECHHGRGGVFQHESVRALLPQHRPRALAGATASCLASAAPGGPAGATGCGAAGETGGSCSSSSSPAPSIALAADFQGARSTDAEDERPAKRPRGEGSSQPARIRCRHILLKHRELKQPTDAVRKQRVVRSREDAEAMLRALLVELLADLGRFPQLARKHSECTSCLRGGEQAGDLGWLTRGAPRGAGSLAREAEEAAFALEVGELSDLVASESGMHLLQRVA